MELFSFSVSGAPFLLSASENNLFSYPIRNEHIGRPFLLCSNYKSGLSGCIYDESLYYTYINRENSLFLRRFPDSALQFRLDGTDTVSYQAPQLIVFKNSLLLFYFEKDASSYRLKLQLPFSDDKSQLPETIQAPFSKLPSLSLQTTGRYLYLFLTTESGVSSYRYSASAGFEPLCSEEELLSDLRLPWETEKKQLEQGLMQAIHLSEQQQALLTEREQKLQRAETKVSELLSETQQADSLLVKTTKELQTVKAQLAECEQTKQLTAQTLSHTSLLLERAKVQYNELMQVAEQYRQEALKWYGKFTDRH